MKMRLFAHSTCFHVKPRHSEVVAQFKLSHYPLGDADTRGSDQKHGNLHRVSKVTFSRWSHFGWSRGDIPTQLVSCSHASKSSIMNQVAVRTGRKRPRFLFDRRRLVIPFDTTIEAIT